MWQNEEENTFTLVGGSEFLFKGTKDWSGLDCLDWAYESQRQLNIPYGSWVDIDRFKYLTGRELLNYSLNDFCNLVDLEYGPQFYKLFRKLVKERREDKNSIQCFNGETNSDGSWLSPITATNTTEDNLLNSILPSGETYPSGKMVMVQQHQNYYPSLSPNSFGEQPMYDNTPSSPLSFNDDSFIGFPELLDSTFDELNNYDTDGMNEYLENIMDPNICQNDFSDISPLDFDEESVSLENLIEGTDRMSLQTQQNDFRMHPQVTTINHERNQTDAFNGKFLLEKLTTGKRGNRTRNPRSWEFLVRLLTDPSTNGTWVRWENKEEGIFKLLKKEEIARLWGSRSNNRRRNEPLTYENFARNLRHYYKRGILLPVSEKHLVYKLGPALLKCLRETGKI